MKLNLVIGQPIEQSLSPLIHSAGIRHCNLEEQYAFWAVNVKSDELEVFFQQVKKLPVNGISVTLPHKVEVIKYLDWVSEDANIIGAVNTIVCNKGKLSGYNTDWHGVYQPLLDAGVTVGMKVLIIGAGGASRSAVYASQKLGLNITVANRSLSKTNELTQIAKLEVLEFSSIYGQLDDYQVIINTTPIGMYPHSDDCPIANPNFNSKQIVFDCVYNPLETTLIKLARSHGAKVILGLDMFIEQAALQFELYTNTKAPIKLFRKVLEEKFKSAE